VRVKPHPTPPAHRCAPLGRRAARPPAPWASLCSLFLLLSPVLNSYSDVFTPPALGSSSSTPSPHHSTWYANALWLFLISGAPSAVFRFIVPSVLHAGRNLATPAGGSGGPRAARRCPFSYPSVTTLPYRSLLAYCHLPGRGCTICSALAWLRFALGVSASAHVMARVLLWVQPRLSPRTRPCHAAGSCGTAAGMPTPNGCGHIPPRARTTALG
jgi:hypothetical protein